MARMTKRVTVTWDEHEVQVVRYSETLDVPEDLEREELLDYVRERATYEGPRHVRLSETEHAALVTVNEE